MATKIYTKTGDDGETGLFGGQRVDKNATRIESYGEVDELNSIIGLVRSYRVLSAEQDELLATVQGHLFVLGADLAAPKEASPSSISIPRVTSEDIVCLESAIDRFEATLPPLKHFILPGGSIAGATLHQARTVARRAERRVVKLYREESSVGKLPIRYLNRLSDFLFVFARVVNHDADVQETPWIPNKRDKA